jgi:hypothetical protein
VRVGGILHHEPVEKFVYLEILAGWCVMGIIVLGEEATGTQDIAELSVTAAVGAFGLDSTSVIPLWRAASHLTIRRMT